MYYILYHLRPSYLNYGIDGNELNWTGDLDQFIAEIKQKKVVHIMNDNLMSVAPDEPLMSVLDRMIKNSLRRISVVDNGRLVGVVYMCDIFFHLFAE
jgi:predicted transcriptional regulator